MARPRGGQRPEPAEGVAAASTPAPVPVPAPERRAYESPMRRQQAARTRDRIVAAGAEMVHAFPSWDWRELTVRAVARRAGVNESTIYRYFSTERRLHDAVMRRLEEEAGVEVENLRLDEFAEVIARVFAYLASFPVAGSEIDDPTFAAIDRRRREALVAAVGESTTDWPEADRETAAAMLDVFWSVATFERLTTVWKLDPERATRAAGWVIGLIETAVREGRSPGS